jgi:hypothetical protein
MPQAKAALSLEHANKLITFAQRSITLNWESFINAEFSLAKEQLQRAVQLVDEAQKWRLSDPEACIGYAEEAAEAARNGYYLSLPSRVAETRGVWYRPVEKNREEVCHTMDRIQAAGINELYLEAWFWGYTIYPSHEANARGIAIQNPAFQGWDPLDVFVKECRKRDIALHVWLDGFMVGVNQTGGPVLSVHPEWSALSRSQAGSVKPMPQQGTGYYWLDITNPEVRRYMLDIIQEMITIYGVDGINLDFMRFPHTEDWKEAYCFSSYARKAYSQEYGIDPVQIDAELQPELWTAWMEWLEHIEDDFVKVLCNEVKHKNPKLIVSAAPELGAEADKIGSWTRHMDVVIPQAYYNKPVEVRASVQLHLAKLSPGNLVYSGIYPMYIGLGAIETVEQVAAAKDLDHGTVIFAFGQATDDVIHALRQGPWRNKAISAGLFPQRAIQALLLSMSSDVEQVYIPRGGMNKRVAIEAIDKLSVLKNQVQHEVAMQDADELVDLESKTAKLMNWINELIGSNDIHPTAAEILTTNLKQIRELLLYIQHHE